MTVMVPDNPLITAPSSPRKSVGTTTSPSRRNDSRWPSRTSWCTRETGWPSRCATSATGKVAMSVDSPTTSFTGRYDATGAPHGRSRGRGRYRHRVNAPPAALLDARYRVGPLLARGGMSTVYRGTDTRLDRPVAIKVMDQRLAADPAFRNRFEREARSAARIDHPAVVDVHDQGQHPSGIGTGLGGDGPLLFLVMELVEGGTLRDVLRARGALGVPAAFAVMEPVLAGLAEAHRLGLVHRDVKPENVLISRAGEVKVADFGLVTAAAQAGASHAGMILGTVAYLSPEQVTTGSADARSDVYAVGVLAYELLTGTVPFTGDTAISVAYRHVHEDVPAPSARVAVP